MSHDRALIKINRLFSKSQQYLEADPEVSLMLARKTAEAICKLVYKDKISANTKTIMLDKLLEQLGTSDHLPRRIINPLKTIQTYGNFGSHDQDEEFDEIDSEYASPCLSCLEIVYTWLLFDYLKVAERLENPDRTKPSSKFLLDSLIILQPPVIVKDLAHTLGLKPFQVVADLMELNVFASINQEISPLIVAKVARRHGMNCLFLQSESDQT